MSRDQILRTIGQSVRVHREAAGLSQAELADKIGLTRASVSNLEGGRQDIPVSKLAAITAVLGCPPAELLGTDLDGGHIDLIETLAAENARLRRRLTVVRNALNEPLCAPESPQDGEA